MKFEFERPAPTRQERTPANLILAPVRATRLGQNLQRENPTLQQPVALAWEFVRSLPSG
ncbi:MAG: hypothetical protein HS124_08135 [Anaerolineales bacterium]|nr:hypothetical protein [Anaerolineales bacterium]